MAGSLGKRTRGWSDLLRAYGPAVPAPADLSAIERAVGLHANLPRHRARDVIERAAAIGYAEGRIRGEPRVTLKTESGLVSRREAEVEEYLAAHEEAAARAIRRDLRSR